MLFRVPALIVISIAASACIASNAAQPMFEEVVLKDLSAGASVAPLDTVELLLSGTELWDRTVTIEVVRNVGEQPPTVVDTFTAEFTGDAERQTATAAWVVTGSFLTEAAKNELRFRAVFEGASLTSEMVVVEVDPAITDVTLTGLTAGQTIRSNTSFDVRLVATDLPGQPVSVEFTRETDGATEVIATVDTMFDDNPTRQNASVSWDLDGDFLDAAGRSEIYAVVKAGKITVESSRVVLDIAPRLVSVTVLNPPSGASVEPGDQARVSVVAEDAWGRPATVDVIIAAESNPIPMVVASLAIVFDDAAASQAAVATWVVPADLGDRVERYALTFVARYAGAEITSDVAVLEVVPKVTDVGLFHVPPGGVRASVAAQTDVPYVDKIVAEVRGSALVDQSIEVRTLYDGQLIDSSMMVASSNTFTIEHQPNISDIGARERVAMTLVFTVGGETIGASDAVLVARRGIYSCEWADAVGNAYAPDHRVAAGTIVRMRARTWGATGSTATWEIWESDRQEDDFVVSFNNTIMADLPDYGWTSEFTGDGVLDTENEYYFKLKLGTSLCTAPILNVQE